MPNRKREMTVIYSGILVVFAAFLFLPLVALFLQSFQTGKGFAWTNYVLAFGDAQLGQAMWNSVKVSGLAAMISTVLAFTLAYTIHCTRVYSPVKRVIQMAIVIPMLLPTITYGFAIIYSFGKQGLITQIIGQDLFEIYGFNGLLMGYVLYTVPTAFLLIHNSFKYIDKKFITVSYLMGDRAPRRFVNTILRPLAGTLGGVYVLTFILSFTDFGIPASIGGTYPVVATELYQAILGSIPNFGRGAIIALLMLVPAAFGIMTLTYLKRYEFHYDLVTEIDYARNKVRDLLLGTVSVLIVALVFSVFAVMLVAPFMTSFPYDSSFTLEHFAGVFKENGLREVFYNSVIMAVGTALFGTLLAYSAAVLNVRTSIKGRSFIDLISMFTNTVPGLVLGISYLLLFKGSSISGTMIILILCNIVHYFTTPYLMAKNALSKMNPTWETTGELLGDSWLNVLKRVVVPNSFATVLEMFSYYFINSMVTISGIIFLVSTETEVISSKIQKLQHFAKFNEIFVLSLMIFAINLTVKLSLDYLQKKRFVTAKKKTHKMEGKSCLNG